MLKKLHVPWLKIPVSKSLMLFESCSIDYKVEKMDNNKTRCLKRIDKGKKCHYIAEVNGYCRYHQNEPLHFNFWQKKDEKERLYYLQILAEMRAVEAYNNHEEGQKSDMSFNRNLRMVAALSKLRHELEDTKDNITDSEDKWVKFLAENEQV